MSLKPILDTYLDSLVHHADLGAQARMRGNDKAATGHHAEVERLRQNIHTLSGTTLDLSERALLNRHMKG